MRFFRCSTQYVYCCTTLGLLMLKWKRLRAPMMVAVEARHAGVAADRLGFAGTK